ncbi:ead/Ea22-like family protein [Enterobacter hormaechei]
MSNIDKQELREAAERAESDIWGFDRDEFNEALTPSTVLVLLDELEAAEKRIAELERKEQHSERQSVIDALASSGEEWSDIEEYMQKWDAERAAAAGKGEAS